MAVLGKYTEADFLAHFPIDFGLGIRGSYIVNSQDVRLGVIVVHQLPGNEVCGGSAFWVKTSDNPLWCILSKGAAPLTLDQSIACVKCPENVHGHIVDGKWVPVTA